MKTFLHVLFFFLFISHNVLPQWYQQTSGTSFQLNGVCFTDSINGTVVGNEGTILRTTNGGLNWTQQTSGTTYSLYGVSFTDVNTGTAVGSAGKIYRTTDGGTTWIQQISGTTASLRSVSFTDENNGTGVGGTILRTTDGGSIWTQQSSGTNKSLYGVSFTDMNNGTAVGWPQRILSTTNGGINWTQQIGGPTYSLYGVSFTDVNNGTAVGVNGRILGTTNGGTTWFWQSSGTGSDLQSVNFTDANIGTIVGEGGTILRTTNGGTTWIQQTSGTTRGLLGVSFTDANNGTAVGSDGTILRTTNGGVNPSIPSAPTNLIAIVDTFSIDLSWTDNSNNETGFVVERKYGANPFIVIDTVTANINVYTNSGLTPNTTYTYRVYAFNNNYVSDYSNLAQITTLSLTLVAPTNLNAVVNTYSVGLNWTDNSENEGGFVIERRDGDSTSANPYTSIDTVVANINMYTDLGLTANTTYTFRVYAFNDGGTSGYSNQVPVTTLAQPLGWIKQISGTTATLYSVSFTDENNGTAVGDYGTILRTTNGGTTWTQQTSGTTANLRGVSFTDANNGTAVAIGNILRTTNGGQIWTKKTIYDGLYAVSFTDANTGTAVGDAIVIRTTDGGTTWFLQSINTDDFWGVSFLDENFGITAGNEYIIYGTTNGGLNWIEQITGLSARLFGVSISDINNRTAVGELGTIYRTTDGGTTWYLQSSGTTNRLYGVSFTDASNGTVVGSSGTILRTTNGGTTWIQQTSGTTSLFRSVSFTDVNNGTAVGEGGIILRTTTGGNPVTLPIWSNEIFAEDAEGAESLEILTFGQHVDATDGIDASLGEYELPPPPPTGIFDSRFNLPTNPQVSSIIDYRDSTKTEITWKITFQPGVAGYPMTFSWDSLSFPEGTFYLKDLINSSYVFVNMKNQSSYVLTEPTITSLNIIYRGICDVVSVSNEWNMISVPLLAEDMSVINLYPTATSDAYGYDGSYVAEDTLVGGKGYWLRFGGDEEIQICGLIVGDTISVQEGWNMIGPFEEDILVNQITTTPPGIIATYFFGFENSYFIADTLKSGEGYWVRVTEDGVINLNGGTLEKDGEEKQPFTKIAQDWGRIKITDSEGKSITLFATEEEIDLSLYELPPIPPTGIFDARYSSGKLVENISSEKTIQISSDDYPITIKAEGINITVRDRINGELLNEELKNGEEIRITNNKITSIVVTGKVTGGLPITYELYQNYPNPFNPSTTIKFSVPKESNVNLSVYNILGELVSTVVNEQMKAGYYEYEFNASSLASGVYLYRIKAGGFVETKKMVLMK